MLLNLSGAHGPFFTRNIVLIKDSSGHTGLGEVPGGEKILQTLQDAVPILLGQPIDNYDARFVIVTQGSVTAYDGDDPTCTPHVYTANTANNSFVDPADGPVHIIRDESGAVAKTVVVQLIPKGATRRIDVTPAPGNCPF